MEYKQAGEKTSSINSLLGKIPQSSIIPVNRGHGHAQSHSPIASRA